MKKFLLLCVTLCSITSSFAKAPKPKLILQITIDQFSGHHLMRYQNHIKNGGFRYLIDHGIWFDNAHQEHATTETAVGHTTLATGAPPAIHGIIANDWYDKSINKKIYALSDDKYGVSPQNIIAPTFADTLAINTFGHAKIFAISAKDRGAIPLAGKAGKAFWFDANTGKMHSNKYYYQKVPFWVEKFNIKERLKLKLGKAWNILKDCHTYHFCRDKKNHLNISKEQTKKIFSHPFGLHYSSQFFETIYRSPESDALVLNFAKTLINAERLGKTDSIDYLSISLSATDAIGHAFGPYSLESEDNFVRLNRELKNFFLFVDKKIGLNNVLIILSSDHGAGPSPSFLTNFNLQAIEINDSDFKKSSAIQSLLKQYHLSYSKLVNSELPNIYLNDTYLKKKKVDIEPFTLKFAKVLSQVPGVYIAVSKKALYQDEYQLPYLEKLLTNQLNDKRSGDVYVVTNPHTYFGNKKYNRAHHGSPWRYDTHVPIIFSRPDYKPKRIHHYVTTLDIAPTLSYVLDIPPPAQSTGKTLKAISR